MSEQSNQKFHLDKSVSVGHILTTVVITIGLVSAWVNLSDRVSVLEVQQRQFEQRMDRQESRRDVEFGLIRDHLRRIENKIDEKADK